MEQHFKSPGIDSSELAKRLRVNHLVVVKGIKKLVAKTKGIEHTLPEGSYMFKPKNCNYRGKDFVGYDMSIASNIIVVMNMPCPKAKIFKDYILLATMAAKDSASNEKCCTLWRKLQRVLNDSRDDATRMVVFKLISKLQYMDQSDLNLVVDRSLSMLSHNCSVDELLDVVQSKHDWVERISLGWIGSDRSAKTLELSPYRGDANHV